MSTWVTTGTEKAQGTSLVLFSVAHELLHVRARCEATGMF
jgi:hypothetical protein